MSRPIQLADVRLALLLLALCSIGLIAPAHAHAQGRGGCRSPQPPSVGLAIGRSLPYLEPAADIAGPAVGSVSATGGLQVAARADLPVTGPFRVRIEGAGSRWNVRETIYDPEAGFQVASESSLGSMSARHFVALVGVRAGRAPACAHVSAGGGFYSIGFRSASLRRAGFAISAGIDASTGRHGAIQADATLHLIRTGEGRPITTLTAAPTLSLLIGWAYRF